MSKVGTYKDQIVVSFKTKKEFYAWLGKNHQKYDSFWMMYYKKISGHTSIANGDAVDVALCWGWIDGLINKYDELSYVVRFTPRRSKSVWSKINVNKVEKLIAEGLMRPSGLAHIEAAKADGRWEAAYAGQATIQIPQLFYEELAKYPTAQSRFEKMSKSEKYTIAFKLATLVDKSKLTKTIQTIITKLDSTS